MPPFLVSTSVLLALTLRASMALSSMASAPIANGLSSAGSMAAHASGADALLGVAGAAAPELWTGYSSLPAQVKANLRNRFGIEMAPLTANVRANDPTGDAIGETQSEVAVTADASGHVVVAWNDSKGFTPGSTLSSYATSCDYGASFTDGGNVPLLAASDQAFGDCTLANDGKGHFYLAEIYTRTNEQDVAVHKGSFTAGCPSTFSWGAPVVIAVENTASSAADKPYIAADPVTESGRDYVYVTYTRFTNTTTIVSVASTNGGVSWGAPVVISTGVSQFPTGSRPVVDVGHVVHVVWETNGASGSIFCDLSYSTATSGIGYAPSFDRGVSYSIPVTIAGVTAGTNPGSGPGNRRLGLNSFPDVAVDGNRKLYVIWSESATWGPPAATGVTVPEGSSDTANNLPSGALSLNPGDNVTGSIGGASDADFWKLNLTAGQHLMLRLEPQGFSCGVSGSSRNFQLMLFATPLNLAASPPDTLLAGSNQNGFASEAHFDVKQPGTYHFRVRNVNSSGVVTGTYTVKSRLLTYTSPNATTPARDARDIVMVTSADSGSTWSAKSLVDDAPADYDEELPFICADPLGNVFAFWFDRRETETAPRTTFEGQWTDIYVRKSPDSGASFLPGQRISDQSSFFNGNIQAVPNMGDYNSAVVAGPSVYAAWSDERISHTDTTAVDAYVDRFPAALVLDVAVPPRSTLARVQAAPNPVREGSKLSFTLPMAGPAALEIVSVTGSRVWREAWPSLSSGEHWVTWNGRETSGIRCAPGVYWLKLTTAQESRAARFVVVY